MALEKPIALADLAAVRQSESLIRIVRSSIDFRDVCLPGALL